MINNNLIQMAMQLKSNPMQALSKFGIPQDIANDPNKIIQHLMNNGRVSQEQYNRAIEIAKRFGYK